ncbi:type II toxin-antitoxin system Phd/YefM family antitoxin [Microbacterium sp.]|uniref:type II toxin-antitoxin system Phd/YefM family antitoxin n=1 Tax=Microbacterium sp. TaxID=51671 RepID=UPI0039E24E75
MADIPVRELRNDTAGVLRRVEAGEDITITVHGRPVARLVPARDDGRRPMPREEFVAWLNKKQADPGLRDLLRELASELTDDKDLGW